MKIKYLIATLLLLNIVVSCSQNQEETKLQMIVDKLKDGEAGQAELDELLDAIKDEEGITSFDIPQGKFRVVFPVTNVEYKVKTLIINDLEKEVFSYSANMQTSKHPNLAYLVDYTFLPEIKTDADLKDFFKSQREYVLSATNSKLEYEEVIEKNNAEGRHLYFSIDGQNLKTNYKLFFKNGIFYKLAVVTPEGNLFNNYTSEFFDSFEITD